MAYTYNDWLSQTTISAKLARLQLHIAEVSAEITGSVGAAGQSWNPEPLRAYYESLMREMHKLEAASAANSGMGRLRTIGGGRVYG